MRTSLRKTLPGIAWVITAMFAPGAIAAPAVAINDPGEILYLQVFINGVDQEIIVRVDRIAGELFVSKDDLAELGFVRERLPVASERGISLQGLPGVRAEYDAVDQLLKLQVADEARVPQVLSNTAEEHVPPQSASGLVLDYSLHWQQNTLTLAEQTSRLTAPLLDDGFGGMPVIRTQQYARSFEQRNRTVTLGTGLRFFAPWGLIQNRGYATYEDGETQYIRDDTWWTYSSPESIRSYYLGDFIGAPLAWTRALRLGGARVARNFGLRPDLVTFALPALGGTAVVPTTVDLFVNGTRQFTANAQPGPFVIADAPPLTGAGNVSIRYRDALGQEIIATQPLYVDTRLLETGFLDYDFEYGYPRRNYGTTSFDYGGDPATLGSMRYGLNDEITLEAHTELADGLQVLGAGALWKLGKFGVLTTALAGSNAEEDGWLSNAGYQYISPRWSFDVQDRRTHGNYQDVGTLEGVPVPRRLTRGSLSVWITSTQALTANYAEQIVGTGDDSRVISAGYRGTFRDGHIGVYANFFRDLEADDSDGFYLAFSIGFGTDASAYSSFGRLGDEETATLGISQPVDYDRGGFGWSLQSERGNDDYQRGGARVDYRAGFADLGVRYERSVTGDDRAENVSVFGDGSLVVMRGGVYATRAIYDGFALVSTQGLAGVPVLRENRELGVTNQHGYLLVPDLPSWRSSKIGIDLTDAPVDVASRVSDQRVNPRAASGVIVEFPIERMHGATLVLVDGAMRPLPPGTRVRLGASDTSVLVGFGGQVFFASLADQNHLTADLDEGTCEVDVPFDSSQVMKIIGPFMCESRGAR